MRILDVYVLVAPQLPFRRKGIPSSNKLPRIVGRDPQRGLSNKQYISRIDPTSIAKKCNHQSDSSNTVTNQSDWVIKSHLYHFYVKSRFLPFFLKELHLPQFEKMVKNQHRKYSIYKIKKDIDVMSY